MAVLKNKKKLPGAKARDKDSSLKDDLETAKKKFKQTARRLVLKEPRRKHL